MKHAAVTEEIIEQATLYAIGAMNENEALAYREHLVECETCRRESSSFEDVTSALAYSVEMEPSSSDLKSRLLEHIGEATLIDSSPFVSIRANEGEWKNVWNGVKMKLLHVDDSSGLATSIVRMMPGTRLPQHRHEGVEQFYILEGDCTVDGERLGPGDYHRAEAGSIHSSTSTEHGTMFLLVAPLKYDFGISP